MADDDSRNQAKHTAIFSLLIQNIPVQAPEGLT